MGHRSCDGNSAESDRGELACLRLDGSGGPRDIAGAQELLDGCFHDVTMEGLNARIATVSSSPGVPAVDFCKDINGTTMVANDCVSRRLRSEHDRASLAAKKIYDVLDEKGRTLLRASTRTFAAYLDADGEVTLEEFDGGSARVVLFLDRKRQLEAERAEELEAWSSFHAPVAKTDDVARARREHEHAAAEATSDVPEDPSTRDHVLRLKKATDDAEKAWRRYLDADVALYTHGFGKSQGAARVRDAVTSTLTAERTKALASSDVH